MTRDTELIPQARLRLATVVSLESRRRALSPLVHREKIITGQLVPFPSKRTKQGRPVFRRNAAALPPLLNGVSVSADVCRHSRERLPRVKNILKRAHVREFAPDELSGQGPPMIPMTISAPIRTIRPMGRGTTPVKFRSEMAKRLKSARVVAGYATQKQAADALRVGIDRYEKWESGRTPIPAQYVGAVCELYGVDANYLYGIESRAAQRRETA